MNENLLTIKNLKAKIDEKAIIKDLSLSIKKGETHIIMGPNGCGKSTLSKILAGHPSYEINSGNIEFDSNDLLQMDPEIRSHEGLFLAFQYPLEIAGVTNFDFLRIAYNEKKKYHKQNELDPLEFMEITNTILNKLKIKPEILNRDLNQGFSGGEKKRNEILQMLLLNPKLVILDEIDSGLDIDAIKIICEGIVNNLDNQSSLLVITHYPKILSYLKPDFVHIMIDGKIIKTGGLELVKILEEKGYDAFV